MAFAEYNKHTILCVIKSHVNYHNVNFYKNGYFFVCPEPWRKKYQNGNIFFKTL